MHTERTISRKFARILERHALALPSFGVRSLVKTIDLPEHVRVIGVGGATIGGSGKTPLAIAVVRALAERGAHAAFVSHGYGANVPCARVVQPNDEPRSVGDESIVAARALRDVAPVVVAPSRGEAIRFAARSCPIVVVDHLHQTAPRKLDLALLALDDHAPWGSGRTFPFGDLVQSPDVLRAHADLVVRIGSDHARSTIHPNFPSRRVGVITSVARPERVLRSLRELGVEPCVHVERGDHAPSSPAEHARISALAARHALDGWLADDKSAVWLGVEAGVPIVPLRHRITLAPSVVDRLARTC